MLKFHPTFSCLIMLIAFICNPIWISGQSAEKNTSDRCSLNKSPESMSTLNIPMTKTDPLQKRIGIISLFPKQSGLFFDHRIRVIEHPIQVVDHSIISAIKKFAFGQRYFSHKTSCFPESTSLFHTDVNVLISKNIIEKLSSCPDTTLIPLPPLETEQSVTGYMIEGSWGVETNSVTVKGLLPFFQHHHLDQIIAIVPITHFVPHT